MRSFILPSAQLPTQKAVTTHDFLYKEAKERNIELLPRLGEINEDLKSNNVCGILFGSSLLSFHNGETKVGDIDILVTKVKNDGVYGLDNSLADYFGCSERSYQRIKDYKQITRTLFHFRNSFGNRIQNVSLGFGLSSGDLNFTPGLIIPNKNTFWHIKQLEFDSVGDGLGSRIGFHKEIMTTLDNQFQKENNILKLEGEYFGTGEKISLENVFEKFDYACNNSGISASHVYHLINYLEKAKEEIQILLQNELK